MSNNNQKIHEGHLLRLDEMEKDVTLPPEMEKETDDARIKLLQTEAASLRDTITQLKDKMSKVEIEAGKGKARDVKNKLYNSITALGGKVRSLAGKIAAHKAVLVTAAATAPKPASTSAPKPPTSSSAPTTPPPAPPSGGSTPDTGIPSPDLTPKLENKIEGGQLILVAQGREIPLQVGDKVMYQKATEKETDAKEYVIQTIGPGSLRLARGTARAFSIGDSSLVRVTPTAETLAALSSGTPGGPDVTPPQPNLDSEAKTAAEFMFGGTPLAAGRVFSFSSGTEKFSFEVRDIVEETVGTTQVFRLVIWRREDNTKHTESLEWFNTNKASMLEIFDTLDTEFSFSGMNLKVGDTWYCHPRKQTPPKDLDPFPIDIKSYILNDAKVPTIQLADLSNNKIVFTEDEWKDYTDKGFISFAEDPNAAPVAPPEPPKPPSQEVNTQTVGYPFRFGGRRFKIGQDVVWAREGAPTVGPNGPKPGKLLQDKGKIDRFIRDADGNEKFVFKKTNGGEVTIDATRIAQIQYSPDSGIIDKPKETFTVGGREFIMGDHVLVTMPDVGGATKEVKATIHTFFPKEAKPIEVKLENNTYESLAVTEIDRIQPDTGYVPNPYEGFEKEPAVDKKYTFDTKVAGHTITIFEVKKTQPHNAGKIEILDFSTNATHVVTKEEWNLNIARHLREVTAADEAVLEQMREAKKLKPLEKDAAKEAEEKAKKEAQKREFSLENIFDILGAKKMQPIIARCVRFAADTDPAEREALDIELNTHAKNIFDNLDAHDAERLEHMLKNLGYTPREKDSTETALGRFVDGWKAFKHLELVEVMKEYTNIEMQRLRMLDPSLARFNRELQEIRHLSRGYIAEVTGKHLGTAVIPGIVAAGSVALAAASGVWIPALLGGVTATAVRRHHQREQWLEETGQDVSGIVGGVKTLWKKTKGIFVPQPAEKEPAVSDMMIERQRIMQDMEARIMHQMTMVENTKSYDFMSGVLEVLIEERNFLDDPAQIHERALDATIKAEKKRQKEHAEHHGHGAHDTHGHGASHGGGHGHGEDMTAESLLGLPPKEKEPENSEILALKADRALYLMRQRNPATRSYPDSMRNATNNSEFFTRGWLGLTGAIEGATRTKWGLYSQDTSKYVAGTFVAGVINGTLGAAILSVGAGSFAAKAGIRALWGFAGKGFEGAVMTRGDLHREKEQALHQAYVLLQNPSDDNLRRAEKLIKHAKVETEFGELIKTSLKRGAWKGTKAAALGAGAGYAFDELRYAFNSPSPTASEQDTPVPEAHDAVVSHQEAPPLAGAEVSAAHPLFAQDGILRHGGAEYMVAHTDPTVKIPEIAEYDSKGNVLLGTTSIGKGQGAEWGALTRLGKTYGNFGMTKGEFAHWLNTELESRGFVQTADGLGRPWQVYPSMKVEIYAGSDGLPHVNFIGKEDVDFDTYDHIHVQKPEETTVTIKTPKEPTMGNNLDKNAEHLRELKGNVVHAKDVHPDFKVRPETSVHMEPISKLPEGVVFVNQTAEGTAYLGRDQGHSFVYFKQSDGTVLRTSYEKFFAALPSNVHHGAPAPLADRAMQHEFADLKKDVVEAQHEYAQDLGEKPVPEMVTKEYTLTNPYVKKWGDTNIPVDPSKAQVLAESEFHDTGVAQVDPHPSVPDHSPGAIDAGENNATSKISPEVQKIQILAKELEKITGTSAESEQTIHTAESKLLQVQKMIEARAQTGRPMTESEILNQMAQRLNPDEMVAVIPNNHELESYIRVADSTEGHSFKYWNKQLGEDLYYYDSTKEFSLQANNRLIIHDLINGRTEVVSIALDPEHDNTIIFVSESENASSPQDLEPPAATASRGRASI